MFRWQTSGWKSSKTRRSFFWASGVDGLEQVGQLCQFGAAMEIHVAGIGVHSVAHAAAFMFHAEVLDFMALTFQVITQFEYVGFTTAIRVEKFVNH